MRSKFPCTRTGNPVPEHCQLIKMFYPLKKTQMVQPSEGDTCLVFKDCIQAPEHEVRVKQEIHVLFVRLQAITEIDAAPINQKPSRRRPLICHFPSRDATQTQWHIYQSVDQSTSSMKHSNQITHEEMTFNHITSSGQRTDYHRESVPSTHGQRETSVLANY